MYLIELEKIPPFHLWSFQLESLELWEKNFCLGENLHELPKTKDLLEMIWLFINKFYQGQNNKRKLHFIFQLILCCHSMDIRPYNEICFVSKIVQETLTEIHNQKKPPEKMFLAPPGKKRKQ